MKPNFLIIGSARSGTTSLFHYMNNHPKIVISRVKELNYFSKEKYWGKGFNWYENKFNSSKINPIAIGEASTSYTQSPYSPNVAERIYNYNPDMKLIYVVRDPIERLISHYLQRTKAGLETREFSELFENLENVFYAWQGLYYYQLTHFLKYFSKNQLLLISFDELKKDTKSVVVKLFDYLGVDQYNLGEESKKVHNAAGKIIRKNSFGIFLLKGYHEYIEQRDIPYLFKRIITLTANLGGEEIQKPVLTAEQIDQLIEFYENDSKQLTKEFGTETSHWYKKYN